MIFPKKGVEGINNIPVNYVLYCVNLLNILIIFFLKIEKNIYISKNTELVFFFEKSSITEK